MKHAKQNSKPMSAVAKKTWQGKVSEGTRLYPKVVEASALSREVAQGYLPPGTRVHKSWLGNRWKLTLGGRTRSRCWSFHGELNAFAKCAKLVWEQYAASGGEQCPFDWIVRDGDGSDGEPAVP